MPHLRNNRPTKLNKLLCNCDEDYTPVDTEKYCAAA